MDYEDDQEYTPLSGETQKPDKTQASTAKLRWTNEENAYILNYLDYCLEHGANYTQTVAQEISNFAQRKLTYSAVNSRLLTMLKRGKLPPLTRELINKGTKLFNLALLPPELVRAMQQQRHTFELGELDGEGMAPEQNGVSGAADIKTSDDNGVQRRATVKDGDNSPRPPRAATVPTSSTDSGDSGDDLKDLDWGPRKSPKVVVSKAPKRKRHQSVPLGPAVSKPSSNPSKPNMERTEGVIDLASKSPSPKRRALDPESKTQMANVELPATRPESKQIQKGMCFPLKLSRLAKQTSDAKSATPTKSAEDARMESSMNEQRTPRIRPTETVQLAPHLAVQPIQPVPAFIAPEVNKVSNEAILKVVEDMSEIMEVWMRDYLKRGQTLTPDLEQRLKSIQRTMKREPGMLFERVLQDLKAADAATTQYRDLLRGLIGHQEYGNKSDFPKVPQQIDIDESWRSLRKGVKDAFGTECDRPMPRAIDVGYIAARVDDLTRGDDKTFGSIADYVKELEPQLGSPHSVQGLLSALLCRWLFKVPDPLCKEIHSAKELKLYEAMLLSDGPTDVQHFDKISSKLLFEDDDFQQQNVQKRVIKLLQDLSKTLDMAWPAAPGFQKLNDPKGWLKSAVKLRQTLMISSREYRIRYVFPGTLFDQTWMKAEDGEGFPVADRDAEGVPIVICLFPALVEQGATTFKKDTDVNAALIKNKRFLPNRVEKRTPTTELKIQSKAVVLVRLK